MLSSSTRQQQESPLDADPSTGAFPTSNFPEEERSFCFVLQKQEQRRRGGEEEAQKRGGYRSLAGYASE